MKQTADKFVKRYSTYSGNEYLMESLESWLEGFNFYSVYAEHSHCSLDSFYITVEKDEEGENRTEIRVSNHYSRSACGYDRWFHLEDYCCVRELKKDIKSFLIEKGLL